MALIKHNTYKISTHWLCAIINGDYSGLNENETCQLDDYIHKEFGVMDVVFDVATSSSGEFAVDCITGLMSECTDIDVYVDIK